MTKATVKPNLADRAEQAKVIDYLQKNPELLMSYPGIFTALSIPHQTCGAASLVERQLKMLRDENQALKRNMDELMNIARENQEINQRFHRLALELMDSEQLHDMLSLVQHQVQAFFDTDYVCFRFLPTIEYKEQHPGAHCLHSKSVIADTVSTWLAGRKPVCGQLDDMTNCELFGGELKIGSSAIVPLYHITDLGLLCLGSASKERFDKNKGITFLQQLGQLVSTRLQGLLAV